MPHQSVREAISYETIQNNFSILNRRFEDELAQACRQEGISLLPYSPIGGGVLSGKYNNGGQPDGARFSRYLYNGRPSHAYDPALCERENTGDHRTHHGHIASEEGMSPVTLATAWSKQHDFVASTIVGVSKDAQLDEILAAS